MEVLITTDGQRGSIDANANPEGYRVEFTRSDDVEGWEAQLVAVQAWAAEQDDNYAVRHYGRGVWGIERIGVSFNG